MQWLTYYNLNKREKIIYEVLKRSPYEKKVTIGLIMITIIIGAITYYPTLKEPIKETDTIITDKNGKVVEPINGDNDNIGH